MLSLLALLGLAGTSADGPVLQAPPGFAVDLVLQAPEILWPSANLCLDDGTLLVGEDPMDMSGPSDQPLDRLILLRFDTEGRVRRQVFAEKLNAIFGLELVDGAVYVMNMPYLTRLVDRDGDGVADERTQILSDLGPPAPGWPGGFNDHIVSGIRLSHDGWLYVAVGDKGIPHAHGTDGSELTLRGGGVVRVRPDGSQLELVASGLRNILDVAIDERGEMFTHDNTDDGLGWWTRLTHVVQGGYYGYPWDYREHAERLLPCMQDYGGGSPTGGLVYRESAWPASLQGSLFFCEWAKQKLRRFEVEPRGSSFRVTRDEDFLSAGGVDEFRPVDVCESPDGRFLYVSDWGYGGWTSPARTGRIWRVRRAEDDARKPSALQPLPSEAHALVAALGDASYRRRLRAQRELARSAARDEALRGELLGLLGDGSERARRHALWALVESAPERAGEILERVLHGSDGELRREALRAAQARPRELARRITGALTGSSDPVERRIGLGALISGWRATGIADPNDLQSLAWLETFADWAEGRQGADAWVAHLARRLLGASGYRPELERRALAGELCRGRYDLDNVQKLARLASNRMAAPAGVLWALDLLADLARKPEPWDGRWWGTQPARNPPPAHTLDWEGTPQALAAIESAFEHRRQDVRAAAYEAAARVRDRAAGPKLRARFAAEHDAGLRARILGILGELGDEGALELLRGVLSDPAGDPGLRSAAIECACAVKSAAMLELLATIARDAGTSAEQAASCTRALGRFREPRCGTALRELCGDARPPVAAAAVAALVQQQGAEALPILEPLLDGGAPETRRAVLRALRKLAPEGRTDALLAAWSRPDTRLDAALALCARPDPRALAAYLELAAGTDPDGRKSARTALAGLREPLRARVDELARARQLAPGALELLRQVYSDPAPILDWQIAGPFPRNDTRPDVASAQPDLAALSRERPWKSVHARTSDGFVDLEQEVARESNVAAFARTTIRSAHARRAQIKAGSDDMLTVWLNGRLVHDAQLNRAWSADEDVFEVDLAAGDNELVLRIGQGVGQWSFNLRLAQEGAGALFETSADADPAVELAGWVLAHPGDPARGFRVFRDSQDHAMCIRCHKVFGTGGDVGPDLSDVGAKYPREELLDSILHPSRRIVDGYALNWLELDDGRTLFGLVKRESATELELYDTQGELVRLEKSSIESRGTNASSTMPDGLAALVTREELSDLVAWLATLRGAPK